MAIERTLTKWDLDLQDIDSSMRELLDMQRSQAESAFAKFIQKHYAEGFSIRRSDR